VDRRPVPGAVWAHRRRLDELAPVRCAPPGRAPDRQAGVVKEVRGCEAIGVETPALLAAATVDDAAVVLAGTEAELDDVLGHVAAEANHTRDRRRRVALDAAYARLEEALAARGAPLAVVPDTAPRDAIVNGIVDVLGLTPSDTADPARAARCAAIAAAVVVDGR
jgi:hypothetical protein